MLDRGWTDVICVASGPSLDEQQVAQITAAHAAGDWRLFVINSTWRLFPGAAVLYAADCQWWDAYATDVRAGFAGECWTQDERARDLHGVRWIMSVRGDGLPREDDRIGRGGNSGHQAIALAVRCGARRIVLAGYDMKRGDDGRSHWHGDHPGKLSNGNPKSWVDRFTMLADDLLLAGVEVVNATRETALFQFPRKGLTEALE